MSRSGRAAGALAWARIDARRRWWSLVVIAVLVALGSGTVTAAAAGVRRGATAVDRLLERTEPADVFVTPNDPEWDWEPYRDLPYVEAMTLRPIFETVAFEDDTIPADVVDYPVMDEEFGTTVDRAIVLEGRWYDPDQWDEAVISPKLAETHDLRPGDTVRMVLGGVEQAYQDPLPAAELTGPHITVRIVGVVRNTWLADTPGRDGRLLNSPALVERYPANILGAPDARLTARVPVNAQMRLAGGSADVARLIADIARLSGRSDVTILDSTERTVAAERTTGFEARCLAGFAGSALLAALVLVGLAVTRHVSATAGELATARAIGLTPGGFVAGAVVGPGVAGLGGAALGMAGAVVASRWLPFGLASDYEPAPGTHVDAVVLVAGGVAAVLVVVAVAALSALTSLRPDSLASQARRSRVAELAASLPVAVGTGLRFALERGRGASRVPVLPALAGAVVGVVGTMAALVFNAGLDDAVHDPRRMGQVAESLTATGLYGTDYVDPATFQEMVTALPGVSSASDTRVASASRGDASATLMEFQPDADLEPLVLQGRMPETGTEVLLGPAVLRSMDVEVGDDVELTGSAGTATLRVVGSGLLPEGMNSAYDDAGWVTPDGFDRLFDAFEFRMWLVDLDGGVAPADVQAVWDETYPRLAPPDGPSFVAPDVTRQVATLDHLRVLPLALGAFLALLAAGVVGHALVVAVRRRSLELGVARSLGATPGQTRLTVLMHAVVVALVGIAAGIPLGIAAGRTVWRAVAEFTPLDVVAPPSTADALLVASGAVVVVLVLAALPAWRAGRLPVATILRAE